MSSFKLFPSRWPIFPVKRSSFPDERSYRAVTSLTAQIRKLASAIGDVLNIVVSERLYHTATWDPGTITASGVAATTATVTGAATTGRVTATLSSIGSTNLLISAHVQSSNTVRVVLFNPTGGNISPGSGTLRIDVFTRSG